MKGTRTFLWLDDERPNPDPNLWEGFKTSADLLNRLRELGTDLSRVTMSLDHDLGERDAAGGYSGGTGYEICLYLEELAATEPDFQMPEVRIHSANPVGRAKMQACLESIRNRLGS